MASSRIPVSRIAVHKWLRLVIAAPITSVLSASACSSDQSSAPVASVCSSSSSNSDFGFSVHPVDAQTDTRLAAVITANEGDYQVTLLPGPGGVLGNPPDGYYGVLNRPGLYRLTVSAAGYTVWSRDSVRVQRDANCRIETVFMTVPLTRSPAL